MSRPIASTSAIRAPPALPSDMKTSNGWPLSSSVIVTYIVPSGDSMRRGHPLSRSGRQRLARRCRFSPSAASTPPLLHFTPPPRRPRVEVNVPRLRDLLHQLLGVPSLAPGDRHEVFVDVRHQHAGLIAHERDGEERLDPR